MNREEHLVNYETFDKFQKVSMKDIQMVEVCGKGDIQFTMTLENNRSKRFTVRGALYVCAKVDLVLQSVLSKSNSNERNTENGSCLIYNGTLWGTGSLVDKFYYMNLKVFLKNLLP